MARSRPPSFDFFPDDFVAGTIHLAPTAIGIYIKLLCFQWSHDGIPDDRRQLMRITGATPEELEEHLPKVLEKFVQGEDGLHRNSRLEMEREKKCQFFDKQRANGQKGGRPRKVDCDSGSDTKDEETQNNPPVSSGFQNQEPKQKPTNRKREAGRRKSEDGSGMREEADVGNGEWDIPPALDTPDVRKLLDEFAAMRKKIGKPIPDLRNQSKVLKHFDDVEHLKFALETCIANEWQGLKSDYRKRSFGPTDGTRTFAQQKVANTFSAGEQWERRMREQEGQQNALN